MNERVDCCYQEVTCADCGRAYRCTPFDDYYNSTTLTDGCCTRCLLKPARVSQAIPVCQLCLQPSTRSVCDGCESTGGLYGDWRSDCDG